MVKQLHYLIYGDAIDILPKLKEGTIDTVIVDPPYNTAHKDIKVLKGRKAISMDFGKWDYFKDDDFLNFSNIWLNYCYKILKQSGNLLTFCKLEYVSDIRRIYEKIGFKHHGTIIWHKTNPAPKIRKTGFLSSCEAILWATKGFDEKKIAYTFNFLSQKEMHNFIETPICMGKERTSHPTQKPLKVLTHLIKIFTNPQDIVFDFFSGSGTTCIAAHSLGRKSISIENNKDYFETMKNRVKNECSTLFDSSNTLRIIEDHQELKSFYEEFNNVKKNR